MPATASGIGGRPTVFFTKFSIAIMPHDVADVGLQTAHVAPRCRGTCRTGLPFDAIFEATRHRSRPTDLGPYRLGSVATPFSGQSGGGGWIRTNVGVRQRIYSPPPLATRAPLRSQRARTKAKHPSLSTNLSRKQACGARGAPTGRRRSHNICWSGTPHGFPRAAWRRRCAAARWTR